MVNSERNVSSFLYEKFRNDKAENLEDFIAIMKSKGKEYTKKCYSDVSFKRYWNLCKNLGLLSIFKEYDYYKNILSAINEPELTNNSF